MGMMTDAVPSIASSVVRMVNDVGQSGLTVDARRGHIVDQDESVLVPSGAISSIEAFIQDAFGVGARSDAARRAMAQYLLARLTMCIDGPASPCGDDLMAAVIDDIDRGNSSDLAGMASHLVSRQSSADMLSISRTPLHVLRATVESSSLELQLDVYCPRYSCVILMIFLYCAAAMASPLYPVSNRLTSGMLFILLAPFMRGPDPAAAAPTPSKGLPPPHLPVSHLPQPNLPDPLGSLSLTPSPSKLFTCTVLPRPRPRPHPPTTSTVLPLPRPHPPTTSAVLPLHRPRPPPPTTSATSTPV